jgi:UDP-N-acetylglucosamine 2-epimerase (non-hydrolysing)
VDILFPLHPNPQVRKSVREVFGESHVFRVKGSIHLVEPLDYATMVECLQSCLFVLTDSGGLQEEAPSFGKRILVLRESTERPEALSAGFSQLVGTEAQSILRAAQGLLTGEIETLNKPNPYGDGRASEKILKLLVE